MHTYERSSRKVVIQRKPPSSKTFCPQTQTEKERGYDHETKGQTYHLALGVVVVHCDHSGRPKSVWICRSAKSNMRLSMPLVYVQFETAVAPSISGRRNLYRSFAGEQVQRGTSAMVCSEPCMNLRICKIYHRALVKHFLPHRHLTVC